MLKVKALWSTFQSSFIAVRYFFTFENDFSRKRTSVGIRCVGLSVYSAPLFYKYSPMAHF